MIQLRMHRTGSHEIALVSEIPYIIIDENVIFAPGQGKKTISVLIDKFWEEQAFLYFDENIINAP